MLFQIESVGERKKLNPVPFLDFTHLDKKEKELENLLADNLLDILYEDIGILPILQERKFQEEADLYGINNRGDLVIFELKRGVVSDEAMHQVLRYAQEAGQWSYQLLENKFHSYLSKNKQNIQPLVKAHQEAFQLEHPLQKADFNKNQKLFVVGSAGNDDLIAAVDYWKQKGIQVEFVPYRIYQLGDKQYFEFYAHPYDIHRNPSEMKGILFDTNKIYDENLLWHMLEKSRVSAFGDVKNVVEYLNPKDIVFFSHKGVGIVAAAEVLGPVKADGSDELYRQVKFLTLIPERSTGIKHVMSFTQVQSLLNKSFYWARTIKAPYLSPSEAHCLLKNMQGTLL